MQMTEVADLTFNHPQCDECVHRLWLGLIRSVFVHTYTV